MNKGICCAGNMIVDAAYPIERWPGEGQLTHILSEGTMTCGGAVCNTATDLARLDPCMKVYASGCVGYDEKGEFMMKELSRYPNLDTSMVRREGVTSFTHVMNSLTTHERTFFTYSGGDSLFCEDRVDWDRIDCDILHVGYILLLPALDEPDEEYGTRMARLLHRARQKGILTSVDVVSEAGDRTAKLVPPALRQADMCVINELEAQAASGIPLRDGQNRLIRENLSAALGKLRGYGAGKWCVIHCPEMSCGLDEKGSFAECPSLMLPEGYIRGTVGAGDAFCAGVLYAAEKEMKLSDALECGTCTAAAALGESGASEGIGTYGEVMCLKDRFGFR